MSDFFSDIMKNGALDSLTADQLDELILRAQAIRSEQQKGKEETRIDACPHCGSIAIKKHGTTSKGSIRMICKDCGKTFTLSEHPNTRLTRSQLTALFTGVIENLPIGKLAERMGVSRSTAHRHKIQIGDILFQTLAKDLGAVNEEGKPTLVFEGIIQCDEWYCPVSFKGKRNPEFFIWKLRRFPRHNMTMTEQDEYLKKHGLWEQVTAIPGYLQELRDNTKTYKRGISNEQVCIIVAVDDEQRIIAKPVSVGRLETTDAQKLLSGRFGRNTTFVTDSHGAYYRDYQSVYGLHEDTAHQHLHFAVNTVSFETGKMYSEGVSDWHCLRGYIQGLLPKWYVDFKISEGPRYAHSIFERVCM